ncbi:MAG TPA: SRPBCC family protein [Thermoanaerobaculia bacterium]|nr:SRPBCC family protein [Thermoanaerobaculia bacterium]
MTSSVITSDRIEKNVLLQAPRSRVWRALTNAEEFSSWFGVKLENGFVVGEHTTGNITNRGYEHIKFDALVERIEPEEVFAFRWHPYPIDAEFDAAKEQRTLVEFRLAEEEGGTRLSVIESGFDRISAERRDLVFSMNSRGWASQMENIKRHVSG